MFSTECPIASIAFFVGGFCVFVPNSLIRISTNFIYFATRYIFSSPAAVLSYFIRFRKSSARFQFLIIAFLRMFLFVVSITIWSGVAYSSALFSLPHSQKVHVFPAVSTLLQKVLKV